MTIPKGNHSKTAVGACALVFVLICWSAGASKTVPIGIQVEIDPNVKQQWTAEQKGQVRTEIFEKFRAASARRLMHWDFVDPCSTPTNAVLILAVIRQSESRLMAEIILVPGKSTSNVPEVLVDACCWETTDYIMSGSPDANNVIRRLSAFLKRAFPDVSGQSDDLRWDDSRVLKQVPLATRPKRFDPAQQTFVLPLPKARYQYLCWSKFQLRGGSPVMTELEVKANGEWKPYDPNGPDALLVAATAPPPDNNYQPSLVFLREYIPADDGVAWENP